MMRRGLLLAGFLLLFSLPAQAQLTPRYEASGGFDFTSFVEQASAPRLNMLGADGDFAYNLRRWIGVAGDVSFTRNRQSSVDPGLDGTTTRIFTFMAGPRFYPLGHHKITIFGEAMYGGGYFSSTLPPIPPYQGATVTDTRWAWMGGGGIDYRVKDHWAVRLDFDYVSTRFLQSSYGTQASERGVIGVVYTWGVAGVRRKKIK
jgi:opacity protein-like surface antigen